LSFSLGHKPLRTFGAWFSGPRLRRVLSPTCETIWTRMAELYLLQQVTPKRSWTIIIFLRVAICYGQQSARYQLVLNSNFTYQNPCHFSTLWFHLDSVSCAHNTRSYIIKWYAIHVFIIFIFYLAHLFFENSTINNPKKM